MTLHRDSQAPDAEKRAAEAMRKQKQLHNDRCALLAMPEFQRVMADIVAKGGMFQSVMTADQWIYHRSGRQDFAREIWADLAQANQTLAFDLLKPKFNDQLFGESND